jgi:hypothetical protein
MHLNAKNRYIALFSESIVDLILSLLEVFIRLLDEIAKTTDSSHTPEVYHVATD